MNNKNCVYIITNNINNKQYVGVAKDLNKRMYQHSIGHDQEHSYIDKAIVKYGWENFSYQIIDNYEDEIQRKELEMYYIKKYHTHRSENGYNLTWGGEDTIFPDSKGESNPRAQLTNEDVKIIRERRMAGERLSTVYEDYKDKLEGNKRAGFSKIWLHESWIEIHEEFKNHYPDIDNKYYATIRRNQLTIEDYNFLTKYFQWYGPIKYNEIYSLFREKIDWQSFQEICKEIVTKLYGNKSTRRTRNKNGETQRRIEQFKKEMKNPPQYS